MKMKTLWDERLGMLMACGSPGSALAYHLGQTAFETDMLRRSRATDGTGDESRPRDDSSPLQGENRSGRTRPDYALTGWLERLWVRLEAWSWQREMREREAYLAQATDLVDLENRMRQLDGDPFLARARALR